MDLLFVIGYVLAVVLIIFGIVFNKDTGIVVSNMGNFFDASSLAITIGGSIAVLLISYTPNILKICQSI